jgi:hypothetical protein
MRKLMIPLLTRCGVVSCREADRLMSRRLDAQLTWREQMALFWHGCFCATCGRYSYQQSSTGQRLGRLPEEPPTTAGFSEEAKSKMKVPSRLSKN